MNKYLNSGKEIENPEQMKAAIEPFCGILGVKVGAFPACNKSIAGEWDGVSTINNRKYENESMRVWMAYNTGPGNSSSGKFLSTINTAKAYSLPGKQRRSIINHSEIKAATKANS